MKPEITEETQGRVFVHQCPLCQNWQVDYTEWVFLLDHTLKGDKNGNVVPDLTLCHQMVEDVVAEHYREAHPREYARHKIEQRISAGRG